jgi:hypothetical protein
VTSPTANVPDLWHSSEFPACLRNNPQRIRHAVGYYSGRWDRELQLHVPLVGHEMLCRAIVVSEAERVIRVRAFVCCTPQDWDLRWPGRYRPCPAAVHLTNKLRGRVVVDADTGKERPRRLSYWPSENALDRLR